MRRAVAFLILISFWETNLSSLVRTDSKNVSKNTFKVVSKPFQAFQDFQACDWWRYDGQSASAFGQQAPNLAFITTWFAWETSPVVIHPAVLRTLLFSGCFLCSGNQGKLIAYVLGSLPVLPDVASAGGGLESSNGCYLWVACALRALAGDSHPNLEGLCFADLLLSEICVCLSLCISSSEVTDCWPTFVFPLYHFV